MIKKLLTVLALGAAGLSTTANAAFVQSTSNCDGSASGQILITITGCNNGSDAFGYIDYTATAAAPGLFSFLWSFANPDPDDDFDFFFRLNGASQTLLASDSGNAGGFSFTIVNAGSIFGWRVSSVDNIFGAPTVNILLTTSPLQVPEPGTLFLLGAGLLALGWGVRARKA